MKKPIRQNILITGASAGLGRGMALEFAKRGRNLALCARRMPALEELKQELLAINPVIQVYLAELDVNNHEQVFTVFNRFRQQMGTLDRVIVNAGIAKAAPLGTGFFHANKQTAETNFVAALAQCEAALAIFRQQNAGHLVTMSSFSAVRGFKSAAVYAATKAAITSLSEAIRVELLNKPISVSTIHPGFIHTEINEGIRVKPFAVDADTGCRALVKSIEKEPANSRVPGWPWALLWPVFKLLPLGILRKLS